MHTTLVALIADCASPSRTLEEKQILRLRRSALAASNYVLAIAFACGAWAYEMIPGMAVVAAAAAFLAISVATFAAIRSGLNLRAADPSLTRFQMMAAIAVVMFIVYHMDRGREVALFGLFIVFQFGIFRLRVREFSGVILFTLAAHASVIALLMLWRPEAVPDVGSEWLAWFGLCGALPSFAIIGGRISALRIRMREREAVARSHAEMSSDFYWETDAEHRVAGRGASDEKRGAASMFQREVRIGERRWDVASMAPDEAGWRAHRALLDARLPFRNFENSRLGVDGSERHICLSGDPAFDASGAFLGYRGVGSDITARKCVEQRLRDSERHLRVFADNIPVMTISLDDNLCCLFANRLYTEFFGLEAEAIAGRHLSEFLGADVYREIGGHFAQALAGYPATYQRTRRMPDGQSRFLEVKVLPNVGEDGHIQGCFSVISDITEHKRAEERTRTLAHHDSLTGLPNRLLFRDRLAQAIAHARRNTQPVALMFLDLDKFKPVNDRHGHAVGDELLKAVATRIRGQVRDSDTVARIGGDEFTVILPGIGGSAEAERMARKIAAALSTPFPMGAGIGGVEIGTSIGIASYPQDGEDVDALITAADAAMYREKHAA